MGIDLIALLHYKIVQRLEAIYKSNPYTEEELEQTMTWVISQHWKEHDVNL